MTSSMHRARRRHPEDRPYGGGRRQDRPEMQEEGKSEGHRGERRHREGAKTFRRKRATSFLAFLETKQATLQKQLQAEELTSIHPVVAGELKATQAIIDEFVRSFELHEFEEK